MTGLLTTIKNWVQSFWTVVKEVFTWALDGFILLLKFVFYTITDGLFLVVETFLNTIDLSSVAFNYAAAWSGLPPQLIWLMNAVALPQCLSILGAAYLIRLSLNLIPAEFTRI